MRCEPYVPYLILRLMGSLACDSSRTFSLTVSTMLGRPASISALASAYPSSYSRLSTFLSKLYLNSLPHTYQGHVRIVGQILLGADEVAPVDVRQGTDSVVEEPAGLALTLEVFLEQIASRCYRARVHVPGRGALHVVVYMVNYK